MRVLWGLYANSSKSAGLYQRRALSGEPRKRTLTEPVPRARPHHRLPVLTSGAEPPDVPLTAYPAPLRIPFATFTGLLSTMGVWDVNGLRARIAGIDHT